MLEKLKLKIEVDEDTCLGEGACLEDAPSTFEVNDCGLAEVLPDSTDTREQIDLAVKNCPVGAIKLTEL